MADLTPILIKDLSEQTTAADTDYMVIGGADAKKIKWSTIVNLIKTKLGGAATKSVANNLTTASAGVSVLDAYQGKVLDEKISEQNTKIDKTEQTILESASATYFTTSASYAYLLQGGVFAILVINLVVNTAISVGNTANCLTGLPFVWAYDFTIPVICDDGTSNRLIGAVGTSNIRLGGGIAFKKAYYCSVVPVPRKFISS